MKRTAAAFLIAIGSFLEVFYYAYRYYADFGTWWLAITVGAGLTLFLSVLTLLRENRYAVAIAAFLIAFSVITTTTGQVTQIGITDTERSVTAAEEAQGQDIAAYYREQIARLNAEYDSNAAALSADLERLATWNTNAVRPLRERQAEIERLRADYEARLVATSDTLTTHESVETVELNIYALIAEKTGWNAFWIQIALQAALSIFIALMAPSGIILLTSREERAPDAAVSRWVEISWSIFLSGRQDHLMSRESVLRFDKQRYGVLSERIYDQILARAVKRKAVRIDEEGNAIPLVSAEKAKQILA